MSNPIDTNNTRGDNSMNSLNFLWTACFKNGDTINQFDSNGQEHRFAEVLVRFTELSLFILTDNKDHTFIVDLEKGMISYNNLFFPEVEEKKNNIRLIYFRRVRKEIGTESLEEKSCEINYHLGFQYQDNKNQNRQIVLQINKNGEFIIDGD